MKKKTSKTEAGESVIIPKIEQEPEKPQEKKEEKETKEE
jgi:hypothetical protein